jgi:hypothetical protein
MSGPGKISVYATAETALQALLYNFDIGSSKSKPEHDAWIQQTVAPYLWKRDTGLLFIGFASRAGPDGFNFALSKARAESVSKQVFLSQHGVSLPTETKIYVGERAAAVAGLKDGVEDEKWRSVMLTLYSANRPPVHPPVQPRFAVRTVYVKIRVSETTAGPMTDGDGAKAFAIGQTVANALFDNPDERTKDPQTKLVDETFGVVAVTIKESSKEVGQRGAVYTDFKYLEVYYEWGPYYLGRSRKRLHFSVAPDASDSSSRDSSTREMTPLEAEDWLNRPLLTYKARNW